MARQLEESLPALERTDELPALATNLTRNHEPGIPAFRPETGDALDRSLEALRETLVQAETRWQQLEARLADQDRAIRDLQDKLLRANSKRFPAVDFHSSGVPELTEIVTAAAAVPEAAAGDPPAPAGNPATGSNPAALLERIAALEAFIAGQNDHLAAVEAELLAARQRIAELESTVSTDA